MEDFTALIPVIKRARGYRLYALSGKRYLDLSLGDGYNLFGHKPRLLVNTMKQVCEKGLLADLPSVYTGRFFKALRSRFPSCRTFLAASSLPALLAAGSRALGRPLAESEIFDPLTAPPPAASGLCVWRPFFSGAVEADVILPVIPTGLGPGLFVLCAREATATPAASIGVSPLTLAAAAEGLKLLRTASLPACYRPDLAARSRIFTQKDIYFVPRCPAAVYERVFKRFLDAGVLLPPRPDRPAILPFELSAGELQKLVALFDNEPEGENR